MMAHRAASYGVRLALPLSLSLWAVIIFLIF
jgi:hypothetical protein